MFYTCKIFIYSLKTVFSLWDSFNFSLNYLKDFIIISLLYISKSIPIVPEDCFEEDVL